MRVHVSGHIGAGFVAACVTFVAGLCAISTPTLVWADYEPFGTADSIPPHDATTGTLPGIAGMSGGAATYSIPIEVPPGRAGMQPKLSLEYSSRGGNGIAGVGWSLSGLSAIHRCPQTPEQDAGGRTVGVSFTLADRLCLDGQRLVKTSGTYGQANATYKTEIDSYARITQLGGDIENGTACFRLEERTGRRLHYGGVTVGGRVPAATCGASMNGRAIPQGQSQPLSWLLVKVDDTTGNNQIINYAATFGPGEYLPSEITYTGEGNTAGDRSVTFEYELRNAGAAPAYDAAYTYLTGGLSSQTRRLKKIATKVGLSQARSYKLSYDVSDHSGRLLLSSVQLCGTNDTTCHPATEFEFSQAANDYRILSLENAGLPTPIADPGLYSHVAIIPDLDGDGSREVAASIPSASNELAHLHLLRMTPDRQLVDAVDLTGTQFRFGSASYADVDGDGRSELIKTPVSSAQSGVSLGTWQLERGAPTGIPKGTPPATAMAALFGSVSTNIPYQYGIDGALYATDVDGNGKSDILIVKPDSACDASGHPGSGRALVPYLNFHSGMASSGQTYTFAARTRLFCLTPIYTSGVMNMPEVARIDDYDGNGLPDFYVQYDSGENAGNLLGIQRTTRDTGGALSASLVNPLNCTSDQLDECDWNSGFAVKWMDINGDGLSDFVFARPSQGIWHVRINKGGGVLGNAISTGSGDGLQKASVTAFRYANRLASVDFDSDGRSELLVPSVQQGFAVRMCQIARVPPVEIETGTFRCPSATGPNLHDDTSVPVGSQCPAWACSPSLAAMEDAANYPNLPPDGTTGGNDPFPFTWGGLPAYNTYQGTADHPALGDLSVYHFAALKFRMESSTTVSTQLVETDIVSSLNDISLFAQGDDLFGDGLADVVTNVGCNEKQNAFVLQTGTVYHPNCSAIDNGTYGPSMFVDGSPASSFVSNPMLYANVNHGAGLSEALDVPSDLEPSGALEPAALFPDYLSSVTNGVGRSAHWAYAPMGYPISQGGIPLYSIDAETDSGFADNRHYYFTSSMPVVTALTQDNGMGGESGNDSAVFGYEKAMYHHYGRGFQGFLGILGLTASSDASRRVLTNTQFHQRFPLAGRVSSITKSAGGVVFEHQANSWVCDSARSACPQSTSTVNPVPAETAYAPVLDESAITRSDLLSGSVVSSVTTRNVRKNKTSGWDAYGNLWEQEVVSKDLGSGAIVSSHTLETSNAYTIDTTDWWVDKLDSSTVKASIVYATTPPGGAPPARTVTTDYAWNTDRTLDVRTVQASVAAQELATDFNYPTPSRGLPDEIIVSGLDLEPTNRTTTLDYTADGYFVSSETNPEGHITSKETSSFDGQLTSMTDAAGLTTINEYDVLGHLKKITYQGADGVSTVLPTSNYSHSRCSVSSCDAQPPAFGPGMPQGAAWRVVNVQQKQPTKVRWFDRLGREIKSAHRGFSGDYVVSETFYDDMGTIAEKSAPFMAGATAYLTGWTYDALGRPTEKIEDRDSSQGKIKTTYVHSGNTTSIEVKKNGASSCVHPNVCMSMTRSYDVLGRLAKTTQQLNGDAAYATTSYWYDGMGNPVAAEDAEGNLLTASYNAVGHRLSVNDPDAGPSSFTYNALGELQTRTDARGIVTEHDYDALGRLTMRTATNSAASDPSLRVIRDEWDYDDVGEDGLLQGVERSAGPAVGGLASLWKETYVHEAVSKRLSTITTEAYGQSRSTSMTYEQGHERTVTYPSGLEVTKSRTATGDLDRLYNALTGETYWQATRKDAWNNVLEERYGAAVTGTHASYLATGQMKEKSWAHNEIEFDEWSYRYDVLGNLTRQERSLDGTSAVVETYEYDELLRLTEASRSNVPGAGSVSYDYTASGNLRYKSDFSDESATAYQYGAGTCGPHAASQVSRAGGGSTTYTCDASGNVTGGNTLTASYDFNNQPWEVSRQNAGTAHFAYTSNGDLFRQETSSRTTYFGPRGYEISGGVERHQLGPVQVLRTGGVDDVQALLRDRLGSQIMVKDVAVTADMLAAPTLTVTPPVSKDGHYAVNWTSVDNAERYLLKERINGAAEYEQVYSGSNLTWSPTDAPRPVGTYAYTVQACAGDVCGAPSTEVVAGVAPPRPDWIQTDPNPSPNGAYMVEWDVVELASSYQVDEQGPGNTDWRPLVTGTAATEHPVTGRTAGIYSYRVRACIAETICSDDRVMAAPHEDESTSVPPAPTWITITPALSTNGAYFAEWDPSTGATRFELQVRYDAPEAPWNDAGTRTVPNKPFSGQSNGKYRYHVQACNSNGCSGYAPNVEATVEVDIPDPPDRPTNFKATPNPSDDGDYIVSWNAVSGVGITYVLEESIAVGVWREVTGHVPAETEYEVTGAPDGSHAYRVKACENGLCGNYAAGPPALGNYIVVIVKRLPPVPPWVTVTPGSIPGHFTVAWGASVGAHSYRLEERVKNGAVWGAWYDMGTGGNGPQTSYAYERGMGQYEYRVKACALYNDGAQQRCSDFTSAPYAGINVPANAIPPTPATISAPSTCPTSPCQFAVTWAAVAGAGFYRLHETNDLGVDRYLRYDPPVNTAWLTRSVGGGLSQVGYDYEVAACVTTGGTDICSPFRGRAEVLVGPNRAVLQGTATAYDAFGQARNGDFSDRPNGTLDLLPETERGFTDHLHADDVWLIHMNGRVYDYQLGRFLSVDPIIQFPDNSQSLNPYSYILNNPLSGTDPTGYAIDTRSICSRSPGSCGAIYKMDSASAVAQLGGGANRQTIDAMTPRGADSSPTSGQSNDIGSLGNSAKAIVVAQNGGMTREQYNEIMGEDNPREAALGAVKRVGSVTGPVADVVDEVVKPDGWAALGIFGKFVKFIKAGGTGVGTVDKVGDLRRASGGAQEATSAVKWTFGGGKSPTRWANQMTKRGWSEKQIDEALSTQGIPARNAVNPGNPATRHIHPETGQSVVIDRNTKEIIHIGGRNFDYSDWDLQP